jgi:glycosyltransferase involved in cell wall biosynthesis
MQIIIVMPVYEDWESAGMLCTAIDECLTAFPRIAATILLVDDGSSKTQDHCFPGCVPRTIRSIKVLRLRRNLGHQRAIAVALAYVQQKLAGDAAIIMDADGEDRPEDIPRLVKAFEASPDTVTVFAERGRRVESPIVSFIAYSQGARSGLATLVFCPGSISTALLPTRNSGIIMRQPCLKRAFDTQLSALTAQSGCVENQQ